MTAALLAALSALVYGTGDFFGGTASRRAPVIAATFLAKASAVPVLLVVALVLPAPDGITLAGLAWGAAAGGAGVFGIVLFYLALSLGRMSVVAPTTAAACAVLPVCVGVAVDGSPGTWPLLGVAAAVAGVALVSAIPGGAPAATGVGTPRLIGLAILAGVTFGAFFALLDRAGSGSGQWPLVAAQAVSLVALAGTALVRRTSLRVGRSALPYALGAGLFDTAANVLYVLANNAGELAIVAVIASLYPASTVVLAMLVDRERIRGWQVVGLGLAGTALVLLATAG